MLVVSLVPVGTASGAIMSGSGVSSSAPERESSVKTRATDKGVIVRLEDLARDVLSVDIYRSESAGVEGSKLNDEPVTDDSFLDATAKPGVQYFYTVKVAKRASGEDIEAAGRARTAAVLEQVKADVFEVDQREARARAEDTPARKGVKPSTKAGTGSSAGAVSAMAVEVGASGVTTLAANTTWSPANDPYYVRNDVIVPAGVTLTILPGTQVYFDTVSSGNGTAGTWTNPTDGVDLVVHGKLVANGTAASPLLFTSIRSITESATSDGLPEDSDWGSIYVDGKAASQISHAQVQYASTGVWAYRTARPYVTDCDFRDNGTAVFFDDPITDAATPRPVIAGNMMGGNQNGILMYWSLNGTNVGSRVLDPYIVDNQIRASTPIDIEIYEEAEPAERGSATIKGTIEGNVIVNDSSEPVYIYAEAYDEFDASVLTAFADNQMKCDDNDVVDCEAWVGGAGKATVSPSFNGDRLTGYNEAFYGEADNDGSSTETNTGGALVNPIFIDCQLMSSSDDAIYLDAEANGAGGASTTHRILGGSVESGDSYAVDTWSWSEMGWAASSPLISDAEITTNNGESAIYLDAVSDGAGTVFVNPRIVFSTVLSGDSYGLELYGDSAEGDVFIKPTIDQSDITSYNEVIYADADSSSDGTGDGNCDLSPAVTDSMLKSFEDDCMDLEADTRGTGSTTMNPKITDSLLVGGDGYGIYMDADSEGNSTQANPVLTGAVIRSYSEALYGDVDRSGGETTTASATCSPVIKESFLESTDSSAMFLGAWNSSPGGSNIKPIITDSAIVSDDSYGLDLYAWRDADGGTAEVSPTMTRSMVMSEDESLYMYANTSGVPSVAKVGGAVTDTSLESMYDSAVYVYVSNPGDASVTTKFTRVDATALDDYGYEFYATGSGTSTTTILSAPVVTDNYVQSGDGIYVEAMSNTNIGAEKTMVDASISGSYIYSSWDTGVYTWVHNGGTGDAVNDSSVYDSMVRSYSGVHHEAFIYDWWSDVNGTGDAINRAVTSGVSAAERAPVTSIDGDGVYTSAYSRRGDSENATQIKNLVLGADEEGIDCTAYTGGFAGQTAVNSPVISGNLTSPDWLFEGNGVYIAAGADSVVGAPVVSGNRISNTFDSGVYLQYSSTNAATLTPTIVGNAVSSTDGNNVEIDASAASGLSSSSKVTVLNNKLRKPALCNLFVDSIPNGTVEQNDMAWPGWDAGSNNQFDTSCIYWEGVDSSAVVRGNMFRGARSAAVYYGGDEAAKTNWNSFGDCNGLVNRPFNYWVEASAATSPTFDARNNWWGTSSATAIDNTINHPNYGGTTSSLVDFSGALKTCAPTVKSMVITTSGTTRKFTITFDRPMNKAVTTLYFGPTSPYHKYEMNGTWNAAGTVFVGKYTGALPTGVWMYVNGAKDLPGSFMAKKGFRL